MKAYSNVNWYEKSPEEVLKYLCQLEKEEQYPFISFLMQHFPDLEIDWLDLFEEYKEQLILSGKIDEVLSFVEWYKQRDLDYYIEMHEYIERKICDYFIYKKDIERLKERMAFIQQYPVPGIDTLINPLLFQLIYHGYYDLAVQFSQAVWKPIKKSQDLYVFASYPFISTIYVSKLQKLYEAHLNGKPTDEDKLFRQMLSLGFEDNRANFNMVISALRDDLSLADIMDSIQKGSDDHMLILNIHFLKYMLHTYQLPFVLSEWLWNNIAATNIFGKQKGIENWFYIDAKTLDDYISSKLDKFFTSNQLEIFGKVWGLDFVFEFLHQQQLLSAEYYEKMKENITYCKLKMIRFVCGDLWQMTFIFNWPRTSNYIDDPSEKSVFNSTFGADFQKSTEIINQYLSDFEIPSRIKKELKVSNSKPIIPPSIWPETQPVKKGQKIGRNDLCPCGSGKKYKKCCLK